MTMAEFKAYMDGTTNKKLDGLQSTVQNIEQTVASNSTQIAAHGQMIKDNKSAIDVLREEVRSVKQTNAPLRDAPPSSSSHNTSHDAAFAKARRSLRLWPVEGNTVRELWKAAGDFMRFKLGLENQLADKMVEAVTRVEIPSGPGVSREVLIVFRENHYRDTVLGAVSKLSDCIDANGKPTAGVRIEVPSHLLPTFRTLFKYGSNLRARHGPGTRRHVKFDDLERTLFLNVKLPGDPTWSVVSADVAKRGLKARAILTDEQLERRFDITGPLAPPRPRAMSLASQHDSPPRGRRTASISVE